MNKKCEFSGCKCLARWSARRLWGKGGVLLVCDAHKPDVNRRPKALQYLPLFYEVKPLAGA
jgi:hypothetical protein